MNDRASWLAARKQGIGGSEIAAVIGIHPYMTPVQLWANKTGRAPDTESALRLRFGQFGEEFVAKEYEIATGRKTLRHNAMLRHRNFPVAIGNVDRLIVPDGRKVAAIKGEIVADRLLEAKTVSSYAGDEWGEPGTDEVPMHYLLQVHWYLSLTPCASADLAALFGAGENLAIYTIKKDAELEDELLHRAQEWWDTYVAKDMAPEPRSEDDVALLYPQARQKEEIEASEVIAIAVSMLKSTKETISEQEEYAADLALTIKRFMGHADILLGPDGKKLATWGNRKGSSVFDLDTFVGHLCPGANPDERALFIEDAKRTFTTRGEPGRTFLLK